MTVLHARIGNPETQHGVADVEEYKRFALGVLRQLHPRTAPKLIERTERPAAYVSDGRWVMDCLACGNGPSAHPEWGIAVCCECGAVYKPTFPKDWSSAERVLLARDLPAQRHFFPDVTVATSKGLAKAETVGDLIRENAERGVPIGPAESKKGGPK